MNCECQHCEQLITGRAYRVTSEDSGVKLLDMTVCYYCFIEARRLGLHAEDVPPRDSAAGYRAHA
jgi:hypothetical protein